MTAPSYETHMVLRDAILQDAGAVARLSAELGYPTTESAVRSRLASIANDGEFARHVVLVADVNAEVVGWIEVVIETTVVSDAQAEILGMVVDGRHRGKGVGSMLLSRAEEWARERGVRRIRVRSNVVRERTHEFYLERGNTETKRQVVFQKDLR